MVKIENKNGFEWITCENLEEVAEEFKKFRNSQSQRGKYEDYFFLSGLRHKVIEVGRGAIPDEKISSVKIYQKGGIDLALDLFPLGLKDEDWKPYKQKVEKILKEIWETGEVKKYQGLDLNWPVVSRENEENSDPDHPTRVKIQKDNPDKNLWIALSLVAVGLVITTTVLVIKKNKKKLKRISKKS